MDKVAELKSCRRADSPDLASVTRELSWVREKLSGSRICRPFFTIKVSVTERFVGLLSIEPVKSAMSTVLLYDEGATKLHLAAKRIMAVLQSFFCYCL